MYNALLNVFSTSNLIYLLGDSLFGLFVGVLPAIGGAAGLSLLIPFIFGMDPNADIAIIMGMLATQDHRCSRLCFFSSNSVRWFSYGK